MNFYGEQITVYEYWNRFIKYLKPSSVLEMYKMLLKMFVLKLLTAQEYKVQNIEIRNLNYIVRRRILRYCVFQTFFLKCRLCNDFCTCTIPVSNFSVSAHGIMVNYLQFLSSCTRQFKLLSN